MLDFMQLFGIAPYQDLRPLGFLKQYLEETSELVLLNMSIHLLVMVYLFTPMHKVRLLMITIACL